MQRTTPRLQLVPVSDEHFDIVFQIFTNEHVRRYLCDNNILSKEQVEDFISTSKSNFSQKGFGLWLVIYRSTGLPIGLAGLWEFFHERQPQLLYALLPEFTGKGYATEASKSIIDYSFNNLGYDYLDASCDNPNLASHNTARRLGMRKVREEVVDNKPLTFYTITKEEYTNNAPSIL